MCTCILALNQVICILALNCFALVYLPQKFKQCFIAKQIALYIIFTNGNQIAIKQDSNYSENTNSAENNNYAENTNIAENNNQAENTNSAENNNYAENTNSNYVKTQTVIMQKQ